MADPLYYIIKNIFDSIPGLIITKAKLEYGFLLASTGIFLLALIYGIFGTKSKVPLFSLLSSIFIWLSLFYVVADELSGNGIDEAVFFHLNYGLTGAGFSEYMPLLALTVFLFIASLFVPYMIIGKLGKLTKASGKKFTWVAYILVIIAFVYHPTSRSFYQHFNRPIYQAHSNLEKPHSVVNKSAITDFDQFYRNPNMLETSNKKLNLIYIYAEGFERTYFNQKTFPNLIKELAELEQMSHSFTNIRQAANTSWTIAGMVASQCGIPLITPGGILNANSITNIDLFLPGATCIGDFLSRKGYDLSFVNATSLKFAGVGKFYRTHGFKEVIGKEELQEIVTSKSGKYDWGIDDDELFKFAYKRLSKLKQPFAFFTLTTGTHSPGRISKKCSQVYADGNNRMLNAVKCSDKTIAAFVRKVLQSKYAKNTVIVIASDHLAMGHHIVKDLTANKLRTSVRRNLFLVIAPKIEPKKITREGTTLDIASTLLDYLGYDSQVGLGRSLVSKEKSLLSYDRHGWYQRIKSFWNLPKLSPNDVISINKKSSSIAFNDRSFNYPLLLVINKDKKADILFKSLTARKDGNGIIVRRLSRLQDQPFIWVDKCKSIRPAFLKLYNDDCVMYGKSGVKDVIFAQVKGVVNISVNDIINKEKF